MVSDLFWDWATGMDSGIERRLVDKTHEAIDFLQREMDAGRIPKRRTRKDAGFAERRQGAQGRVHPPLRNRLDMGMTTQVRAQWETKHFPMPPGRKRCPDCLGRTMISNPVLVYHKRSGQTNLEIASVCETCNGTGNLPIPDGRLRNR